MSTQTQDTIEQDVTAAPAAPAPEPQGQEQEPAQEQQQTEQPEGDGQPAKKPNGVQKRMDELTRARHEAEREAAYWRQRASGENEGKAQAPAPAAATDKPTPDKFTDYAEYVEALTDWKSAQAVRSALAERDAERAREAEGKVQQTRAQAWAERQAAAREAIADYDEVLSAAADVRVSPHVQEAILDSELGPAIAYHLAKHPDEAERISALQPMAAARELGRLEAALSSPRAAAAPAAAPKTVTQAPAPITPVRGNGGQFTKAAEAMSDSEWFASRKSK